MPKTINTFDPTLDPLLATMDATKHMETIFGQQNNSIQNILVKVEETQQQNRYLPGGSERCERN